MQTVEQWQQQMRSGSEQRQAGWLVVRNLWEWGEFIFDAFTDLEQVKRFKGMDDKGVFKSFS